MIFLIRPVKLGLQRQMIGVLEVLEGLLNFRLPMVALDDVRGVPMVPIRHEDPETEAVFDLFELFFAKGK